MKHKYDSWRRYQVSDTNMWQTSVWHVFAVIIFFPALIRWQQFPHLSVHVLQYVDITGSHPFVGISGSRSFVLLLWGVPGACQAKWAMSKLENKIWTLQKCVCCVSVLRPCRTPNHLCQPLCPGFIGRRKKEETLYSARNKYLAEPHSSKELLHWLYLSVYRDELQWKCVGQCLVFPFTNVVSSTLLLCFSIPKSYDFCVCS